MRTFHQILGNALIVAVINMFVWFAVIFWMYLETSSVLATAYSGGVFMIAMALSSFWFGSIVDHNKKKVVTILSSVATLGFYLAAFGVYLVTPADVFKDVMNPTLWLFVSLLLGAVIASNLRGIAMPTLVTLLVPENDRDKANGMVGMVMGISSMGAGFASGFALAYLGMFWVVAIGVAVTVAAIVHLFFISIPEPEIVHTQEKPKQIDIRGTISAIRGIPGLFALIFFTTFNNFLGGVFMSLMDPYGLSLMRVELWGVLWGVLSSGFILGGLYIAKYGLGKSPLRTLFRINIVTWIVCILFTIQPSIILLAIGILIWVCLMPFIEATEHTIIQKVVPFERQGRVIGFAQSVEMAASPVTAFFIGPIAQFIFIPFMTTGAGVALIGDWFGVGPGRGMALIFVLTGIIGLAVTLVAMRSRAYKLLARQYSQ
ncbi:MFS transporter [Acetobacteraceae bacterium]|nr:MFS transporter [Candidatus Parcubacteria bacterium]